MVKGSCAETTSLQQFTCWWKITTLDKKIYCNSYQFLFLKALVSVRSGHSHHLFCSNLDLSGEPFGYLVQKWQECLPAELAFIPHPPEHQPLLLITVKSQSKPPLRSPCQVSVILTFTVLNVAPAYCHLCWLQLILHNWGMRWSVRAALLRVR